jgi:hypothetical protein
MRISLLSYRLTGRSSTVIQTSTFPINAEGGCRAVPSPTLGVDLLRERKLFVPYLWRNTATVQRFRHDILPLTAYRIDPDNGFRQAARNVPWGRQRVAFVECELSEPERRRLALGSLSVVDQPDLQGGP